MEAYSNPLPRQSHWYGNYWEGVSPTTGVRLGGYLNPQGNLATAFPIY